MANQAPRRADDDPSAAAGRIVVVVALPREPGACRAVAGAIANVEEALSAPKAISPSAAPSNSRCACSTRSRTSLVPDVHLDDAPAASKGLREGGHLCHHPVSAISFGSRTSGSEGEGPANPFEPPLEPCSCLGRPRSLVQPKASSIRLRMRRLTA